MKFSRFDRYALSFCVAAAMLAGCAGIAPLSPSPAGITTERTRPSHTYGVLYSFKGGSGDGEEPEAGLVNVKGTLYGTTYKGGANDDGTVFKITTSGAETVLHSFGGSGDGALPLASLLDVKGTLYGTTYEGGANGDGTVFKITTSGAETVLYSFKGAGDGGLPVASLINVNGALYSTTFLGGANDGGTVFKITTSGAETVLHSFPAGPGDGYLCYAGLLDFNGTLYGTTYSGGADTFGTVFSITTSGVESVLYSFKGPPGDGLFPYAGLLSVKGTLYGATYGGGANYDGTIFKITTSGAESVLYSFKGGSGDGEDPETGLINVKDALYGTTYEGGANGDGTVFKIATSGAESVLYSFKGGSGDGEDPEAALLNVKGTLYGTTYEGGANGDGTVFSVKR